MKKTLTDVASHFTVFHAYVRASPVRGSWQHMKDGTPRAQDIALPDLLLRHAD